MIVWFLRLVRRHKGFISYEGHAPYRAFAHHRWNWPFRKSVHLGGVEDLTD